MKIITILVAVFSVIAVQPLSAQFTLGVFGNLSSSNLSGNAPSGTEYTGRTAFGGGIIADYKMTDEVTLSLQPMLLPKGTTISYDLPSYEEQRDSLKANFSYISLPIMVKVTASKLVYVTGGIEIDFLQEANVTHANSDAEQDISSSLSSIDVAANFGVGFTFTVASLNIFIEGRYSQGLMNISEFEENSSTDIVPEFKNSGMQILAGILFPIGSN